MKALCASPCSRETLDQRSSSGAFKVSSPVSFKGDCLRVSSLHAAPSGHCQRLRDFSNLCLEPSCIQVVAGALLLALLVSVGHSLGIWVWLSCSPDQDPLHAQRAHPGKVGISMPFSCSAIVGACIQELPASAAASFRTSAFFCHVLHGPIAKQVNGRISQAASTSDRVWEERKGHRAEAGKKTRGWAKHHFPASRFRWCQAGQRGGRCELQSLVNSASERSRAERSWSEASSEDSEGRQRAERAHRAKDICLRSEADGACAPVLAPGDGRGCLRGRSCASRSPAGSCSAWHPGLALLILVPSFGEVLAVCTVTSTSSAAMDVAAKGWAAPLKQGPSSTQSVVSPTLGSILQRSGPGHCNPASSGPLWFPT